LFFPNRFNKTVLASLRASLGSYGYAGQYSQRPSPEEGGILKKKWFGSIPYELFKKTVGNAKTDFFLDTAYTEDSKNDPTALMACCYHNHVLYILNSKQAWLELPDLLKFIPDYVALHKYSVVSRILIEPKASGKSTVQSFKKTRYNVIELPAPTESKLVRVNNITPFVESGKCVLVEGSWNDLFLGECAGFPNAAHDDQVDNLANAIAYYTKPSTKLTHAPTMYGRPMSAA
jgi:predicted phage terminase large subunit-like protein